MQEIHKIEPASEEWWLFRKPISESTITDNVLHWGTGGLNIDGCRVGVEAGLQRSERRGFGVTGGWANYKQEPGQYGTPDGLGRWPANVMHDGSDEVVGMFPQTTSSKFQKGGPPRKKSQHLQQISEQPRTEAIMNYGDSGSAARFFYSTKSNARHNKNTTISQGKPMYTLHHGDCLEVLQTLPDNSVDSIVTDPPAGIAFMNMQWDKDKGGRDVWIAWMEKVAKECLRVMKPGGHALVWSLPRTSHWTGTAWENAGWEPRDKIYFLFGTGFPKSMNIGKQIDKMRGDSKIPITAPATEEAKQWDGWGTGLKPASEEWWLFRKPISETTIADNVLHWGTGGLNIDGCRVGTSKNIPASSKKVGPSKYTVSMPGNIGTSGWNANIGRWPANVVHDGSDEVVGMFPDTLPAKQAERGKGIDGSTFRHKSGELHGVRGHNDFGGSAARFFYGAKASVRDRDEGLSKSDTTTRANIHPTVKSTELMRYLCRLITPPHGIVLDPFAGSGSTGKGALKEGFQFIGIEMDEEYYTIARARLEHILKGS